MRVLFVAFIKDFFIEAGLTQVEVLAGGAVETIAPDRIAVAVVARVVVMENVFINVIFYFKKIIEIMTIQSCQIIINIITIIKIIAT